MIAVTAAGSWKSRLSTVRARTTLLATLVVAVALVVGGALLLTTLRQELVHADDAAAQDRLRDLAGLAGAEALPGTLTVRREDDLVEVVDASGALLAAGPTRPQGARLATFEPTGDGPQVHGVEVSDHGEIESYRVWALAARTPDGPVRVYVGTNDDTVGETVATVRTALVVGLPLLLVGLAMGTWVLVGRALRPVEAIRAEVAEISQHDLGRRVPAPTADDEVARLARTMNEMLDRLEDGSRRQRAFVADSSHELQSPLAALRTQLEVGLVRPASTDWPATAGDLLGECQRMERLVGDLLYVARADGLPAPPRNASFDLDDVVLEEVARLRATARVEVDTSRVSAAPMTGSRDELTRLTRNLVENAQRHAHSVVSVELSVEDEGIRFVVTDDGPGVPEDQRQRVFDRFARLDDARTRSAGGTGLGLAIVRDIARRHGGDVVVEDARPGARFVVTLGLAPPRAAADQQGPSATAAGPAP